MYKYSKTTPKKLYLDAIKALFRVLELAKEEGDLAEVMTIKFTIKHLLGELNERGHREKQEIGNKSLVIDSEWLGQIRDEAAIYNVAINSLNRLSNAVERDEQEFIESIINILQNEKMETYKNYEQQIGGTL